MKINISNARQGHCFLSPHLHLAWHANIDSTVFFFSIKKQFSLVFPPSLYVSVFMNFLHAQFLCQGIREKKIIFASVAERFCAATNQHSMLKNRMKSFFFLYEYSSNIQPGPLLNPHNHYLLLFIRNAETDYARLILYHRDKNISFNIWCLKLILFLHKYSNLIPFHELRLRRCFFLLLVLHGLLTNSVGCWKINDFFIAFTVSCRSLGFCSVMRKYITRTSIIDSMKNIPSKKQKSNQYWCSITLCTNRVSKVKKEFWKRFRKL